LQSRDVRVSVESVQPRLARWYSTLQPITPPPMTATRTCELIDLRSIDCYAYITDRAAIGLALFGISTTAK
jgi:hypothetical protein